VIVDPRAVLLDVDGCLLLSDRPGGVGGYLLPGAAALVERLRETGRPYLLFTNASSRTPRDYATTWRALGLLVDEAQVVTPAVVAAGYLSERGLPVLAFGGTGVDSYRAYRFRWVGRPHSRPAVSVQGDTLYASWNGATEVRSWQLLGGPGKTKLRPLLAVPKTGFETAILLPPEAAWVAVRALDRLGRSLSRSAAVGRA